MQKSELNNITILGIETSCDETAAAVYSSFQGIRSSILFSQIDLHNQFGGVVPEIASRSHLQKINPIILSALQKAEITLNEIDVIAVTSKPGLAGSLLVGLCFAKSIAWATEKPLIGINHLEAHIYSVFLEQVVPFPHICLAASGGHTSLYFVEDFGSYTLIGQTKDDAAGEAFDKIAKLLNLGYPGGALLERMAADLNFQDFFSYPRMHDASLDFSFSGLKTAVLYDLVKRNAYDMSTKIFLKNDDIHFKKQIASSLLNSITDTFKNKVERALQQYPQTKAVTFVGGVACNKFIRTNLQKLCTNLGREFFTPSPKYCTDNAAMVAFVGHYKAQQKQFSDLSLDILK